jgi:hypothetical protein
VAAGPDPHVAACHFADAVAAMPVASMFPDASGDQEGLPE